jgi:membrane fusion protein (multidrug efflux system)
MSQTYEIPEPESAILQEDAAIDARSEVNGSAPPSKQPAASAPGRKRALFIFAALALIAAVAGVSFWMHARQFEDTDDAQVDGNLSPIGTRIDGTIIKVYVQNNQVVKVGDPLVDLDPGDNQVAFDQAEAQVIQARSSLSAKQPYVPITQIQNSTNILSARANVASSAAAVAAAERDRDQAAAQVLQQEAGNTKAQSDLKRYQILVEKEEISLADFDQYTSSAKQQAASVQAARSALLAAERTVDQRRAQLDQSNSQLTENESTAAPQLLVRRADVQQQLANLRSAEAQLEQARLNLGYTKIKAPVAGIVMKRAAQVGSHVQAGQQLLTISEIGSLWITANFKETQLLRMRPGQRATIQVDALDRDFNGSVETIGGSTGSIASLLPPENATGNYVKVVQRIPVRIALDANQTGADRLRPGMSVEPKVRVRE